MIKYFVFSLCFLTFVSNAMEKERTSELLIIDESEIKAEQEKMHTFQKRLERFFNTVDQYENQELQEKIKTTNVPSEIVYNPDRDEKLELLRNWFRTDFFLPFVHKLNCEMCGKSEFVEIKDEFLMPTEEELKGFGADKSKRVENHFCTKCNHETRFPRYDVVEKLLDTRRGKCGEWANCFTAIAIALGYDARVVLDFTDHVWTEVYDPKQKRWVHVEICDGHYDNPMLYEQGWGKKLNYILAFSKDGVVDVTKRYTKNYDDVLTRRTEVSEEEAANMITELNNQKFEKLDEERKHLVKTRWQEEQKELNLPKDEDL